MGCPQGGVLSVIIWSLVFDKLLKKFKTGRVKCIGYADDACLTIHGPNLKIMHQLLNKALMKAGDWAKDCGLEISTEKTEGMLFTKRKVYDKPEEKLTLDGKEIILKKKVRYLGVTLDSDLNFANHIDNKISQARALLYKIRSTTSNLWGPRPEMIHWAYKSMVRPLFTYCLFIFAQNITSAQLAKLRTLQRLALKMSAFCRDGTPTEGLNVITGTLPIELYIKQELYLAKSRLNDKLIRDWDGLPLTGNKTGGHIQYLDQMYDKYIVMNPDHDGIDKEIIWDRNY